jgi:sigma-B regulation protein RsbU (phosphoserine phosphatase)
MKLVIPAVELSPIERLREMELEEARLIQHGMFPPPVLTLDGVLMAHKFEPVLEVGGDFLDYFELPDHTYGMYLGDVSGKGLPAALFAALTVGTIRGEHKTGACPAAVLDLLNRLLLLRAIPCRYAALQYAVFYPETRRMVISGGGLPGPVHISAQGCRELNLPGFPPGLLDQASYQDATLQLAAGDSVLFFSDGISDAKNSAEEPYGIERVVQLCEKLRTTPPEDLLECIFFDVADFTGDEPQHDDMTLAVFHCVA